MARFARFSHQDRIQYGLIKGPKIQLIDGSPLDGWESLETELDLGAVKLLPPVDPPNLIAIGLNYRGHAEESEMALPERPVIFLKATTAVCGPEDPIVLPRMAPNEVDYECELAIVIGETAHHVPQDEALDYVLGYTCSNDVSARDCQLRLDAQWARGKSFDSFAPLGPWIETELDPDNVAVRTRLNGEVMQESNTNDLIFGCAELISFLSNCMTLLPGTVIMTGTPSGVGFAREPAIFLKPGDLVEIEIEGIGALRNSVVADEA